MSLKDQWESLKKKVTPNDKNDRDDAFEDDEYEYEEYDDDFPDEDLDWEDDDADQNDDDLAKTTIYHGNLSDELKNNDPEEEAVQRNEKDTTSSDHKDEKAATFTAVDFDEDESEDDFESLNRRQYVRKSEDGSKKGITPTKKILMFICVLFILVPIVATAVYQNQNKAPEPESAEQVMVSKTENESAIEASKKKESESKAKAESESKAKQASESKAKAESESKAAAASAASEAEESQKNAQAQSQAQQASSTSKQETNQNVGTYTVSAGDNLYRIAVNHGMTLDQLLSLNGLSSNSNIAPGTVLRVYQ
ncbi:MAG: LysM domain-containing protein [Aerococcus sp.]|nr:LysM domain-containing protein [Aerococcus sp.]